MRSIRAGLPLASLAACAALGGCGASSPPRVASGGDPGFAGIIAQAQHFASCMRDHGVSAFPDPVVINTANQHMIHIEAVPGLKGSPAFRSASVACRAFAPAPGPNESSGPSPAQRAARRRGLIRFAFCLRSHGVRTFPDPTASGEVTLEMVTAAGVNIHDPGVKRAIVTCAPASGGIVTPAIVNRAERQSG